MVSSNHQLDASNVLAGKFVGVVPALSFQKISHLKRLLLMFDSLALDLGTPGMSVVERTILANAKKDIEWLSREKLLTTLSGLVAGLTSSRASVPVTGGELIEPGMRAMTRLMGRAGGLTRTATGTALRYTASELRSKFGIDAIAVPSLIDVQDVDAPAGHEAVVRIALNEFPLPDESTGWQNIRDFRHDEGSRSQFSRLKQWINRTGKAGLKEYEVADELRELLYSYELGMKFHKMKAQRGILEVVITTTAEVAENLVRFKISNAAKAIFAIKDYKLKLLEEEKATLG
ncbi:MAG TPA: hypothetical protein VKL99_11395, partial [Candidatus Angelobacter sp.]|nr:hypothetical protein [Candidatus Angelobacter sp.]